MYFMKIKKLTLTYLILKFVFLNVDIYPDVRKDNDKSHESKSKGYPSQHFTDNNCLLQIDADIYAFSILLRPNVED